MPVQGSEASHEESKHPTPQSSSPNLPLFNKLLEKVTIFEWFTVAATSSQLKNRCVNLRSSEPLLEGWNILVDMENTIFGLIDKDNIFL